MLHAPEWYMRAAISAASNAQRNPFGAVIVEQGSGEIVARGWNRTEENRLWHGEVDALNQLDRNDKSLDASSLCLYTTAEPCPMCQAAIVWAGLGEVRFGTTIPTLQQLGWNQIEIRATEVAEKAAFHGCVVSGGCLEDECNALFAAASRLNS